MAVGGQTRLQTYVDVSACVPEKLADSIIGVWKPLQVCWTSLCLQRKNSRIVLAPVLVGTDSLSLSLSVCMYVSCACSLAHLCVRLFVCQSVIVFARSLFLVLIPFSLRFCVCFCLPHCSVCLCPSLFELSHCSVCLCLCLSLFQLPHSSVCLSLCLSSSCLTALPASACVSLPHCSICLCLRLSLSVASQLCLPLPVSLFELPHCSVCLCLCL